MSKKSKTSSKTRREMRQLYYALRDNDKNNDGSLAEISKLLTYGFKIATAIEHLDTMLGWFPEELYPLIVAERERRILNMSRRAKTPAEAKVATKYASGRGCRPSVYRQCLRRWIRLSDEWVKSKKDHSLCELISTYFDAPAGSKPRVKILKKLVGVLKQGGTDPESIFGMNTVLDAVRLQTGSPAHLALLDMLVASGDQWGGFK